MSQNMTNNSSGQRLRQAKKPGGAKLAATRSTAACQQAAAILEVLAGVRTPIQAAQALAVSLPRYYQMEQRALAGLLAACEPAPRRGRVRSEASVLAQLRQDNQRLQRELGRQQALARLVQRNVGLPPTTPAVRQPGQKRRQRKPVARALAVAQRLQQQQGSVTPAADQPAGG
jgi:hypothetical protein